MTLLDLVTYLRKSILDDTGGLGVEWQDIAEDDVDSIQLRWSNEELTSFINEAINQVYRRINPIQEFVDDFNITTVAGQSSYTLDKRILQIVKVYDFTNNKELCITDYSDVIELIKNSSGFPTSYIPNYDTGSISFTPTPSDILDIRLLVNRLPLKQLSWASNTSSPELREEFLFPMVDYAAHMAYLKDEANSLDPQKSQFHLQKFSIEFPFQSAYSDVRKRRTSRRGIKYGGY